MVRSDKNVEDRTGGRQVLMANESFNGRKKVEFRVFPPRFEDENLFHVAAARLMSACCPNMSTL